MFNLYVKFDVLFSVMQNKNKFVPALIISDTQKTNKSMKQ